MMDTYDVDHHRHRRRRRHARAAPRPLGQAHPPARARRLAPARAAELVGHRTCSWTTATSRRTPGTTTKGKPFQPGVHYFVGGATKLYGAALYRLRKEDFGELQPPRRHLAGLADLLRRARAVLHAGRAALPGARRARRGPDRAAGERAVPAPGRLARAADPAARGRPRGGRLPPVPRALRDHARRGEHAVQRRASAARPATASPASSTPSPTPRCSACARRSSIRTSRC